MQIIHINASTIGATTWKCEWCNLFAELYNNGW